jgi:hypothetical protein
MNQPFSLHSPANTHFCQKLNSSLFQNTGSHPLLAVLATSSLEHNRMNSLSLQQVRQDQPCGSSSHNPNLSADSHYNLRRTFRRDF